MNITAASRIACIVAASLSAGGCGSKPAADDTTVRVEPHETWSSKNESILPTMPDRPNIDLGEQIAVSVNQQDLWSSAAQILQRAVESTNPLLRANAIEGLKFAPTLAPDAIRRGLGDENRGVRFVSAMLVGEIRLEQMRPFVEPLLLDESESVQAAAIYAVKRLGGSPDLNPLSRMVLGDDPEIKGNAAIVLGELGEKSAVSLLHHALGRGLLKSTSARRKIVELQIAEAMVKLGDERQLEVIRAALFSRPEEGEIIALAAQICGEVKDEASLPNLLDLATRTGRRQQSAEIRMAAMIAASRISPMQAVLAVPVAYMNNTRFELRAQAAAAFGASGQSASLQYLSPMMADANPLVQVSAAAAVLEIQRSDALAQGS